jgi:hypothetical protein
MKTKQASHIECSGKRRIKINVMGLVGYTFLEFGLRDMGQLWYACFKRIYYRTFEIRRVEWNRQ